DEARRENAPREIERVGIRRLGNVSVGSYSCDCPAVINQNGAALNRRRRDGMHPAGPEAQHRLGSDADAERSVDGTGLRRLGPRVEPVPVPYGEWTVWRRQIAVAPIDLA